MALTARQTPMELAAAIYSDLSYVEMASRATRVGEGTKMGKKIKSWKDRLFVLRDGFLVYYESESDREPKGVIRLHNAQLSRGEDTARYGNILKVRRSLRRGWFALPPLPVRWMSVPLFPAACVPVFSAHTITRDHTRSHAITHDHPQPHPRNLADHGVPGRVRGAARVFDFVCVTGRSGRVDRYGGGGRRVPALRAGGRGLGWLGVCTVGDSL